ncbi:MAG: T9SS type A sorting domain-containing protein [Cruoricaptor ignavus]|nr:T9SS type A sorting domain-containing protein [Cruoricaptor ignavus]
MRKLYLLSFLLGNIASIFCQNVSWQKDFPSDSQNFLSQVSVTLDYEYLISGSSIRNSGDSSKNTGYDFHLIKLNQQGNPVWEKFYGGSSHDFLSATTATQEGGFLVAGTSFSEQGFDKKSHLFGGSDAWVIKLSENGEEEWQTCIGTPYDEEIKSVAQTIDLDYFVAGNIEIPEKGFGSKDAWLIKLDKNGNVISQIIFGGTGLDEVERIIPTKDGGCLIAVYSRSGNASDLENDTRLRYQELTLEALELNKTEKNAQSPLNESDTDFLKIPTQLYAKNSDNFGEGDYWILKFDKNGRLQWQKNFGGTDDDRIRNLGWTENGYLVLGESRSANSGNKSVDSKDGTDLWLLALDENGNERWQKSFSFGNRDVAMSLNPIWNATHTEAKGFLLGGYTQAEHITEHNEETFWMLYLDNKGKEVWRKYVEGSSRKKQERLAEVVMANDGTFILAGTSTEELGNENWKIVKLSDHQIEELIEKQDLKIYPNPVENYCYVEIGLNFEQAEISIYDMSGRLLQNLKIKNTVTKLDTSKLPQGIYIITAKTETNHMNAKILKR